MLFISHQTILHAAKYLFPHNIEYGHISIPTQDWILPLISPYIILNIAKYFCSQNMKYCVDRYLYMILNIATYTTPQNN